MSKTGKHDFSDGPDGSWSQQQTEPSWADEALPLEVRRQLLDQELRKIILRKHAQAGAHADAAPHRDSGTSHPEAGTPTGGGPDRDR